MTDGGVIGREAADEEDQGLREPSSVGAAKAEEEDDIEGVGMDEGGREYAPEKGAGEYVVAAGLS